MKIVNLRREMQGDRVRVAATAIWEDCGRPEWEMYFETDAAYAEDLTCDANAFLIAGVVPAMYYGERRVAVDGPICPVLREGLLTNIAWWHHWYDDYRSVTIEAPIGGCHVPNGRPKRAGLFLSGGVDSLYSLRANRLRVPTDHPASIRDGILIDGYDINRNLYGHQPESFQRAVATMRDLSAETGVTLIPVATNLRHLNSGLWFWTQWYYAAALTAVAHVFSRRLTSVLFASASDWQAQRGPWASTAATDHNFSSCDVQILHDGLWVSRLEKLRVLTDWPSALQNLRVCTANAPGLLNCGRCEKCIRTMTALLALGRLHEASAFATRDVDAALFDTILMRSTFPLEYYQECIEPLRRQGRVDLVRAIQHLDSRCRRHQRYLALQNWPETARRVDARLFGGRLLRWKRRLAGTPSMAEAV